MLPPSSSNIKIALFALLLIEQLNDDGGVVGLLLVQSLLF
jgi:hypothetical protein